MNIMIFDKDRWESGAEKSMSAIMTADYVIVIDGDYFTYLKHKRFYFNSDKTYTYDLSDLHYHISAIQKQEDTRKDFIEFMNNTVENEIE